MNTILQDFLKQIKVNIDNSTPLPPDLSNLTSEYISIPANLLSQLNSFDGWMETNLQNQWDPSLLTDHNKALIQFCTTGTLLIRDIKTYEEFCLFSDLVELKGYNINKPVMNEIDFDLAKKSQEISREYPWVGRMISADIIKIEVASTYNQQTLQALNYWGVYNLMIANPSQLSLEKALTLTPEQAAVFDMHTVYNEVVTDKLSIDDAIQKYLCNIKMFGHRRF
jgi:hypothetical protein